MPGDILKTKKNPYSPYRSCVARLCTNTTVKTPEKLWVTIPTDIERRVTWLKLAGRDPEQLSATSSLFLCEDHFDLENDMENYMRYKIMGSVKTVRIKPHHAPSKFNSSTQNGESTSKPHLELAEKQKMVDITASSCVQDSHGVVHDFLAEDRNGPGVQITQAQERNEDAHYKCVCCLMVMAKEKVRTLWQEEIVNGEMKIYGNMLVDCFAFIWNKPEPSLAATDFICTCCIQRLEEAVSFKHQVMVSQQLINNMTFKSPVMIKTENQDTNVETELRYDFVKVEVTDPNDFNDDCVKKKATNSNDFNDVCIKKEATDSNDLNDVCIKKEATDSNDFNDDCESSDVNFSENICDVMCEVKVEEEIDENYDNSDGESDGNFCEDIYEVHEDKPHSSNVGSIGDVATEHDIKQIEVDDESPTADHVQESGQIIGLRLSKAPKTTAERVREYRARQALRKQQSKQQKPDVIVEIATKNEKAVRESSVASQKKAKTAAQRMREYRARKKTFSNPSGHNKEESDLRDFVTLKFDDTTQHKKAHENINRKFRKCAFGFSCTSCNKFWIKNNSNKASNNECLLKKINGSIGDVATEHDIKQIEVDDENPNVDHVQESGQIIGFRLSKAPKTTAERVREYRARQALRKQQSKQQKPDVIVEIATKNEKGVRKSSKKHAETAAAKRMREYRARKKGERERILL